LDDLIDACSDALYEYEGIDKGVSKRSIQADIQMMRSDKLGYNAPIIVVDRKYYTYEDPNYSITNIPLTEQDLEKLSEAVEFMKQFQGFSHFRELDGMVQKLEDHIYSQQTKQQPVIDFEKNDNLKGLEFLDRLYKAIIKEEVIHITYQSFRARTANDFDFHPYLLKEFRNRWFIIGRRKRDEGIMNLALDRIVSVEKSDKNYQAPTDFDPQKWFKDVIGVTVSPTMEAQETLLFVTHLHAPYVMTKPLHHSQQLVEKDHYGITISLKVQHNFELEKLILGFGEGIQVLKPAKLKRRIKERFAWGLDAYNTEITEKGLLSATRRLQHKGFAMLNYVFTQREMSRIKSALDKSLGLSETKAYAQRRLLQVAPNLKGMLFNKNLLRIIHSIDPKAFLVKSIFFDKTPETNWFVSWHQDMPINVKAKQEVEGFSRWTFKEEIHSVCPPEKICKNIFTLRIHLDDTDENNGALKVLPGSHKKRHSDNEIATITENSLPFTCEINAGGLLAMKPLLLHASGKSKSQKRRRVIHLEFASVELPGGLAWLEKEEI
jgi:predicted DNA-binding transcriptional regulator YafY